MSFIVKSCKEVLHRELCSSKTQYFIIRASKLVHKESWCEHHHCQLLDILYSVSFFTTFSLSCQDFGIELIIYINFLTQNVNFKKYYFVKILFIITLVLKCIYIWKLCWKTIIYKSSESHREKMLEHLQFSAAPEHIL